MPFERTLGVLEVVLGIQSAVAHVLEEVAMPVVRSGRGHNADLSSGPFPILGAIGVLEDVVFPHRLYAQQLGACPGGRNELAGCVPPNPVDAVEHEPVGFLPMARHRESGKGATGPPCHIRSVIDNADVENQKLIEAPPIQRQFFDLLLGDQSGGRAQRGIHEWRFFRYCDLLCRGSDFQRQVDDRLLADHEIDAAPYVLLEARHYCGELICAHRKQRHIVVAALAAYCSSRLAGLGVLDGNTYSRYQRSRGVLHHTQDGRGCRGSLSKNQAGWQCDQYTNRNCESSKRSQSNTLSSYHT